MPAVKLDDLLDALDFISSGEAFGNEAYVCKSTGVVHWYNEDGEFDFDKPPDDIDSDDYVAVPGQNELDLGMRLALDFAQAVLPPEQEEKVGAIFSRRGAYRRFKDLLDNLGKLQEWYDYEANARKAALTAWCEANDIEVAG